MFEKVIDMLGGEVRQESLSLLTGQCLCSIAVMLDQMLRRLDLGTSRL